MRTWYGVPCVLLALVVFQYSADIADGAGIGCKNENGKSVDWFIGYKLPRQNTPSDPQRTRGYAYIYMDQSTSGQWKRSQSGIDADQQNVANTINQLYSKKNNANVFYMLYNDQAPQQNASFTKGHTKGVVVFDSKSGFWLVHSVPRFPPKEAYAYPHTGAKYGQSFMCITFQYNMLPEIANQLFLYNGEIYDFSLPSKMGREIAVLDKVVRGVAPYQPPYNRLVNLTSTGGASLISFSKYKKWGKELYSDFVAPSLQRGLYVETWQNGRGEDVPSNCTAQYHVYNVINVTVTPNVTFSNGEDHSKWAVSDETGGKKGGQGGEWICIGDINRQKEQYRRSGGTVCMKNEQVGEAYRDAVKKYEQCRVGG